MISHNTLHNIIFHQMKAKQRNGFGSKSIIHYSYDVASLKQHNSYHKAFQIYIYVIIPRRVYSAIIHKLINELSTLLSLSNLYFICKSNVKKMNYLDFRVNCIWLINVWYRIVNSIIIDYYYTVKVKARQINGFGFSEHTRLCIRGLTTIL